MLVQSKWASEVSLTPIVFNHYYTIIIFIVRDVATTVTVVAKLLIEYNIIAIIIQIDKVCELNWNAKNKIEKVTVL